MAGEIANDHPDIEAAAVAERLAAVNDRIAAAAALAGRPPADVSLVAISKAQSEARVRAALAAGQRVFGENRVQEALQRWPGLRAEVPDLELHFVGHLQSNKTAEAVGLFDVIQSVDRPKLAGAIAAEGARQRRSVRCFIQVNTGAEPQKGGAAPDDVGALLAACRDDHGLAVDGLMCIPPVGDQPAPHFALLAELARRAGLAGLSMGMSGDYEDAVRLGATHVRVGTAIFGPRLSRSTP